MKQTKFYLYFDHFQEVLSIIPLPHKPTHIGIIGSEKGSIIDIKTKRHIRSISKWNGSCTRDGKFGLYAPTRGGLELLELRKGSTGKKQKKLMKKKFMCQFVSKYSDSIDTQICL